MSTRRVPVNAAALLIGRVGGALATVAILSFAAHRLDDDQFGLLASVLAAGFLANIFVTFGTDTVVTRAVAADRPDAGHVAHASLRIQLTVSAVLVALAIAATAAGADLAILLQALALFPLATVTVVGAVLRGRQRMDQLMIATLSGAAVAVAIAAVGLTLKPAPWVAIAAIGLGACVSAGIGRFFTGPSRASAGSAGRQITTMLRETAPFAAMVLLAAVGAQAGLLLVEFASADATGGYGVAIRLSEAGRLVPAAVMGAFFPAMLSGAHRTTQYRRWMQRLLAYALVTTVVVIVVADVVNRVVFDEQPDGTALIRILALGLTLTVLRLAWSFELIAAGRERQVLISAFAGAAVTLIGGLAIAGAAGAPGVAWMQLAGLFVATALLGLGRSPQRRAAPAAPVRVGEVDGGHR